MDEHAKPLVDTVSMGLRHLRELGLLTRGVEHVANIEDQMQFTGSNLQPLYGI